MEDHTDSPQAKPIDKACSKFKELVGIFTFIAGVVFAFCALSVVESKFNPVKENDSQNTKIIISEIGKATAKADRFTANLVIEVRAGSPDMANAFGIEKTTEIERFVRNLEGTTKKNGMQVIPLMTPAGFPEGFLTVANVSITVNAADKMGQVLDYAARDTWKLINIVSSFSEELNKATRYKAQEAAYTAFVEKAKKTAEMVGYGEYKLLELNVSNPGDLPARILQVAVSNEAPASPEQPLDPNAAAQGQNPDSAQSSGDAGQPQEQPAPGTSSLNEEVVQVIVQGVLVIK